MIEQYGWPSSKPLLQAFKQVPCTIHLVHVVVYFRITGSQTAMSRLQTMIEMSYFCHLQHTFCHETKAFNVVCMTHDVALRCEASAVHVTHIPLEGGTHAARYY